MAQINKTFQLTWHIAELSCNEIAYHETSSAIAPQFANKLKTAFVVNVTVRLGRDGESMDGFPEFLTLTVVLIILENGIEYKCKSVMELHQQQQQFKCSINYNHISDEFCV